MPTATDVPTRDRILFTGAELFRRQGYAGTGLKQVASEGAAPFGSIYHHFPGGKEELGEEVLRAGGRFFLLLYRHVVDTEATIDLGIAAFFRGAGETLVATDYADACPIATVAGEVATTHPRLRAAADEAFGSWLDAMTADLRDAGAADADALALALLALLEGAFLLCRTQRRLAPMEAAAAAARTLLDHALPAPQTPEVLR